MKLIRNRKMLQAKRRRYSHLMQSFRATIHEGAQEIAKQHAMILWLAKRLARDITCHRCPAKNTTCNNGYPYKIKKVCSALLIEAAEKAVQDVD